MKQNNTSILLTIAFFFSIGCKIGSNPKAPKQNRTVGDTIFLLRQLADTPHSFYHAIFIDTGTAIRNQLSDFSFNQYDSSYFDDVLLLKPYKNFNK